MLGRKRSYSFNLEDKAPPVPVWVSVAANAPPRAPGPQQLAVAIGGTPGLRPPTAYAPAFAAAAAQAKRLASQGSGRVELTGLTLSRHPALYPFNPELHFAAYCPAKAEPVHYNSADFMRHTGPVMDFDRAVPADAPLHFPLPSLPAPGDVLVTLCNVCTPWRPKLSERGMSWPSTAKALVRFWLDTSKFAPPPLGGEAILVSICSCRPLGLSHAAVVVRDLLGLDKRPL